ncbi:MAG: 2,3-bisphosphoglycerate-independent phosphoglycerate mutase [Candidatus Hydrogenedentota bacterium]
MSSSAYTLKPLANHKPLHGPVVCIVMDGVGLGKKDASDGVHLAYTPVLDQLIAEEPLYCELKTHGEAVGMPTDDDMGNSEVGHNTLGAGRVFAQGAKRVNEAIRSGALFEGSAWKKSIERTANGGTLHLMGLLSDGNVHSHIDQVIAMVNRAAQDGAQRMRIHILLDGRDVQERSACQYIARLEEVLVTYNASGNDYRIASGGGRMLVTMDRYNADWAMVEKGWQTHVLGQGRQFATATEAVETMYAENPKVTDQYLESFVIAENAQPIGTIEDGDAVIFFNFRGDRAMEMSIAFESETLEQFDRVRKPDVFYAGLIQYDGDLNLPANFLLEPARVDGVLGHYLCGSGITSYAISETQKYGHVTYFWNGNSSGYIDESLEKYVEIPSDNLPFDQRPWMKAAEITDAVIDVIQKGEVKFIRLNYPNGDMVGHTGVPAAIRISVEVVDHGLSRLLEALEAAGGIAVILADHGNADLMFTEKDGDRAPMVAHTLNPVPCIIKDYSGHKQFKLDEEVSTHTPGLANIAATICTLLGFEAPVEYDGSLVTLR